MIRRWHAHIFRLPAIDAAAKLPTAFHAVVYIAPAAEKAFAAEAFHVHRDPITRFKAAHRCTCFHHLAHELMPEHHAFARAWHCAMNDVQIARADARAGYAHNRVPRILDAGHGPVAQLDLSFFLPNKRFHGFHFFASFLCMRLLELLRQQDSFFFGFREDLLRRAGSQIERICSDAIKARNAEESAKRCKIPRAHLVRRAFVSAAARG